MQRLLLIVLVLLGLRIDLYATVSTRKSLKLTGALAAVVAQDVDDCIVCMDPLDSDYGKQEGNRLVELPCKHTFHLKCTLPLYLNGNPCPLCREEITQEFAATVPAGVGVSRLVDYTLEKLNMAVVTQNDSYRRNFFSVLDSYVYRTERNETLLQAAIAKGYDRLIIPIFEAVCERIKALYPGDIYKQHVVLKEYFANKEDVRGSTALHAAVRMSGDLCLQELFVVICRAAGKTMADQRVHFQEFLMIEDINECNPLLVAASSGYAQVVRALVAMIKWAAGTSSNTRRAFLSHYLSSTDEFCSTPLHLAAARGNVEIARELFKAIRYSAGDRATEQQTVMYDFLYNFIDNDGDTVLHVAAKNNKPLFISELMEQVRFAAGQGSIVKDRAIIDLLKIVNHQGFTPAQLAANNEAAGAFDTISDQVKAIGHASLSKEVKSYCLQRGPNQNTTLGIAAARGSLDIVRAQIGLLKKKIYPSFLLKKEFGRCNALKRTELHLAAAQGNFDVVNELIKQIYDITQSFNEVLKYIDLIDSQGKTALDLAAENGHIEIVNMIDEKRAECLASE